MEEYQRQHKQFEKRIDSLNTQIEDLEMEKTILLNRIDSTKNNIIYIEKRYEKELVSVKNQSVSEDVKFFKEYIEK